MTEVNGWGIALVLIGGIFNGSFILPMKRITAWPWENIWLCYSLGGMVIFPLGLAIATVPHLGEVYRNTPGSVLAEVALFGLGWGIGSTLFGLGVNRVGMALGYALVLGITASFGSLLPLILLHPEKLLTRRGHTLMIGTALVVVGLSCLAIAGRRREYEMKVATSAIASSSFTLGLVVCIFSGLFSSMLNFSFLFGRDLQRLASYFGSSPARAANSIWCVALSSGLIANAGYCVYLLRKNRTWHLFWKRGTFICWMGAVVMAVIWFGGIVAYGIGAASLGVLGGIVGWPLLMAMTVLAGNSWGAAMGEWRAARRGALSYWSGGLIALLLAIYVISLGGTT